ncbi:hypothetical protein [Acinetobacter haemolyticus]|uniref:hypothetical protein n=1 Tax=Acinetobacter haemolyticus TaxID=29430 RepID=UPI001D0E0039|nr:hypothetical protein [Acinetobacter haemolyticus]
MLEQMPLAQDIVFDHQQCIAWVKAKEKHWDEYGYGIWAFLLGDNFVGWGGLQFEKALLHKPICKGFFSDIIFK